MKTAVHPKTAKTTAIAEILVDALKHNEVEPVSSHTAAPGADCGYVEAYDIGDDAYVVAYGASSEANYDVTDNIDDLPAWLLTSDLESDTVAVANARNQEPQAVTDDFIGEVKVIVARDFFGPSREYAWACTTAGSEPLHFDSIAAAREWIETKQATTYYLAQGESGAPSYFIVNS